MLVINRPGIDVYEPATLWVVGASFLWPITAIIIKVLGKPYNAIVETFYFAAMSAVFALPLALNDLHIPNTMDRKFKPPRTCTCYTLTPGLSISTLR